MTMVMVAATKLMKLISQLHSCCPLLPPCLAALCRIKSLIKADNHPDSDDYDVVGGDVDDVVVVVVDDGSDDKKYV